MAKPSLLFASLRRDTAEHYLAELKEIFRDEVAITTYVFEEDSPPSDSATVILAAGPASYERCAKVFPLEKLVTFHRDISFPYYLDQVLLLPEGTKVLVVNEVEDGAYEVTRQLEEKGINHLEYVPYWENCHKDITGITVALSPGLLQYCPPEITHRIDIRRRHLSVGSFIEILQRLNFGMEYIERLMAYHSNLLFQTYRRLSDQHSRTLRLQKTLATMFQNMTDAILFSENGVVTECNYVAEKLFKAKRDYLLEKKLPAILGPEFAEKDGPGASFVLSINKIKYLCTRTDVPTEDANAKDIRLYTIRSVSDLENLEAHVRKLLHSQKNKTPRHTFESIIVASPVMDRVLNSAREMAKSPLEASILITGESGTGKELFAQAIHNASGRANSPFVAVNFGAIPENLVESELFGYESGAFTGASKSGKKGLFEIARYGTIFLDEIGDASPYIQARLLRVLEEKELMRLGGTKVIPVNVRVIAATNRDLLKMCKDGTFRTDLYHRLNTFPLNVPPLRERRDCLSAMIDYFQSFYVRKRQFSKDALQCIYHYSWPGNARELKNMIDFLTLKPGESPIELEDLPHDMRASYMAGEQTAIAKSILPVLSSTAPLGTICTLLELMDTHAGSPLGRQRLLGKLAAQGISLSDAKCRSLIDFLAQQGLVEKRKTKQGTIVSRKGKTVLAHLHAQQECGTI